MDLTEIQKVVVCLVKLRSRWVITSLSWFKFKSEFEFEKNEFKFRWI